jgi:RNA polymerase sigma-70 factor (ECF subfamily)
MSLSRQDLADALQRVANGDKTAFEQVYVATSMKLYGIVIRILRRHEVADEILQEVYVRVWQRAGEFNPAVSSPVTWLASIARNRALDEAKRKTMRSLEDFPEVLEIPSDDNPLGDHERNEERRRLMACIDRLEADRKQVVLMVYDHGMTREEIATRTGRPVSTVKTWLRRSLAQLKDCLGR